MKAIAPKTAHTLLDAGHHDLQAVFLKCKQLEKLNKRFLQLLDDPLKQHCLVANTSNRRLVLLAANSSIATQLRLMTPDLLRKCKTDALLSRFQEIECIVRPANQHARLHARKTSPAKRLSTSTAALVNDMAESLEDPALKAVMKRIAEKVDK